MTDRTLLGIVGSVSADSRTRTAVEVALDAAADRDGVETDVLHLADYDLDTADGRGIDNYEGDTAAALDLIVEADAYVVGTPVYRGSYSGALKNLLDMVPRGQWQGDVAPFENAAVGLVATGRSGAPPGVRVLRGSRRGGRDVRERRRLRRRRARRRRPPRATRTAR